MIECWQILDSIQELPMNYIDRALERGVRGKAGKVTLVTGARQVGKSTMLRHLFPKFRYVTLDDGFSLRQAEENPAEFLESIGLPVIIDEAQRAPSLFRQIKILCDTSNTRGKLYLSGSQQYHLMKGVTESLAGRIHILELPGFSQREQCGDPFADCFIHHGGYPELAAHSPFG